MSSRLVVAESPPTNIFFVRITCVKTFRSLGIEFEDGNYQFGVGLPRHGNLRFYQLPVQLMGWIVQHLNWQKLQYLKPCKMIYLSHTGGLSKGDESESARPPRRRVLHHHHLGHVTKLREVLTYTLGGGLKKREWSSCCPNVSAAQTCQERPPTNILPGSLGISSPRTPKWRGARGEKRPPCSKTEGGIWGSRWLQDLSLPSGKYYFHFSQRWISDLRWGGRRSRRGGEVAKIHDFLVLMWGSSLSWAFWKCPSWCNSKSEVLVSVFKARRPTDISWQGS